MAVAFQVNVVEHYRVSPPPDSTISPISLPLTYFDIPWLSYSPNRTLFFYQMPPPKTTTTTNLINLLKQSLSLTLHHFYPLAGNLSVLLPPAEPQMVYTEGDSVSFTVAESNTDIYNHLSSNHPRTVANLSSLLPQLLSPTMSRSSHTPLTLPLLAIQITVFGDSRFAVGVTSQHAAADERTLCEFMNCWASFCKSKLLNKDYLFEFKSSPWFDRSVILDPISLKTTLLKQWWNRTNPPKVHQQETEHNIVQSTFFLSSCDISKIKHHIVEKCKIVNEDPPLNLSLYETGVAYIWICLLKVEESHDAKTCPIYLGYNASGISRLKYDIPLSYFGCCIVFGRVRASESELLDENGLVCATKSFDIEIDRLVRDFLEGSERWIAEWDELNVRVIGSPKVDFYGIDFGWGKAEKIEKLPGDDHDHDRVNVISLNGGRDLNGGLEIGVVLSEDKMTAFTSFFNSGLKEL